MWKYFGKRLWACLEKMGRYEKESFLEIIFNRIITMCKIMRKKENYKMKVVIMAGGKGTRIQSIVSDIPKPMIPINGVPVLEIELCLLRDQGFNDFIFTVGYLADCIVEYFGDGSRWNVHIEYYRENNPLGNAGALFKLNIAEDFLFIIGDAIFDIDFNRMLFYHRQKGGLVTLFTHANAHPYDSSVVITDKNGVVLSWLNKEDKRPQYYKNRVNAGIHIISPKVLEMSGINPAKVGKEIDGKVFKVDLDRQLLQPLCGTGKMFSYNSPEYVKDMGTPERFYQVEQDLKNGIIKAKNLKNKQKAIFLDRDGTINHYVGFLHRAAEFELVENSAEAIKMINASNYLAIVVTNQPVIARGETTFKELEEIHNKMETLLGQKGAYLDAIYFCPHHPHSGFEGEVSGLKIDCDCRKPKPGMLFKAAKDFNIDLFSSYMIGDSDIDIQAGINAGCKSIRIEEGGLLQAVNKILKENNS